MRSSILPEILAFSISGRDNNDSPYLILANRLPFVFGDVGMRHGEATAMIRPPLAILICSFLGTGLTPQSSMAQCDPGPCCPPPPFSFDVAQPGSVEAGDTVSIQVPTSGPVEAVSFEYSLNGGAWTSGGTDYIWPFAAGYTTPQCVTGNLAVRVTVFASCGRSATGFADTSFAPPPPGTISIGSPSSSTAIAGDVVVFSWVANFPTQAPSSDCFALEASFNGGATWTTVNPCQYPWWGTSWGVATPSCTTGSLIFRVTNVDACGREVSGQSVPVPFAPPPPGTISIGSPSSSTAIAGDVVVFSWVANFPTQAPSSDCFALEASFNGGATWTTVNPCQYPWWGTSWGVATPSCTTGSLIFRVTNVDACGREVSGQSVPVPFAPPATTTAVHSPIGGESLLSGAATTVTWSGIGVNNSINIDYRLDTGNWMPIATGTPNDGNQPWTLPTVTSPTRAQVRVAATNSCTNQPITATSSTFTIVPTCDDGNSDTLDTFDLEAGECVVIPDRVTRCLNDLECALGSACRYGVCIPRVGIEMGELCKHRPDCKFRWYSPVANQCFAVRMCSEACCQGGVCVCNDLLTEDSIETGLEQALIKGAGFAIQQVAGVLQLTFTTNSPGYAYRSYTMPSGSAWLVFEYQLSNVLPDENAVVSFAGVPLWRSAASTSQEEWVTAYAWVGDFAGQVGTLTFALVDGSTNPPDDEFRVRRIRVYGSGHAYGFPGDVNLDGSVDGRDLQSFVDVLLGSDDDSERIVASDLDGSGVVDSGDVPQLVFLLLN